MGGMYYLNPLPINLNKEEFDILQKFPFEGFTLLSTLFLTRKLRQKYLSKYSIKSIFLVFRPISILTDEETQYCLPIDTKSREKSSFQIRSINLTQIERLVTVPLDTLSDSAILNLTIDTREIVFPRIMREISLPKILQNYPLLEVESETLDIPILDVYLTYTDLVKAYETWKNTKTYYIESFIALSSGICILNWFEKNLVSGKTTDESINLNTFSNCILKVSEEHVTKVKKTEKGIEQDSERNKILEDIFSLIVNDVHKKAIFSPKENVLMQILIEMRKQDKRKAFLEKINKIQDILSYTLDVLLEDFLCLHTELNIHKIKSFSTENINQVLIPFTIFVVQSKRETQWYIVSPISINQTKSNRYSNIKESPMFEWFKNELSYELDENVIEDYSRYNILDNYDMLSRIFRVLYSKELRLFLESDEELEILKEIFVKYE